MVKLLKTIVLGTIFYIPFSFGDTNCSDKFLNSTLPDVKYDQQVCYTKFAVLYNYNYKIPMVSAEYLTPDDINASSKLKRKDAFHSDKSIPPEFNQTVAMYKGTGYDKGHMTPAGDMDNAFDQSESFSLANMTPQTKKLNEIVWRGIEEKVRNAILSDGAAYIITGSIVQNSSNRLNTIVIPDYIYKAVYFVNTKKSIVYVAKNDNSGAEEELSEKDFEVKYKIKLF